MYSLLRSSLVQGVVAKYTRARSPFSHGRCTRCGQFTVDTTNHMLLGLSTNGSSSIWIRRMASESSPPSKSKKTKTKKSTKIKTDRKKQSATKVPEQESVSGLENSSLASASTLFYSGFDPATTSSFHSKAVPTFVDFSTVNFSTASHLQESEVFSQPACNQGAMQSYYSVVESGPHAFMSSREEDIVELDEKVIVKSYSKPLMVPGEHDLIDKHEVCEVAETLDFAAENIPISKLTLSEIKLRQKEKRKIKLIQKEEREKQAQLKKEKLSQMAREISLNKSLLAYIEMCVFGGQLNKALKTLNYYVERNRISSKYAPVTDINCYNILIHGFAAKRNINKVKEISQSIQNNPHVKANLQTLAAILEVYGRHPQSTHNSDSIQCLINEFSQKGLEVQDLFSECEFCGDQREVILDAIQRVYPNFITTSQLPNLDYVCQLLQNLNDSKTKLVSPIEGLMTKDELRKAASLQLETEFRGFLTIKSIEKKNDYENVDYYRALSQQTEEKWKVAISAAFKRNMNTLLHQAVKYKSQRVINLYPFLNVLNPEEYQRIVIREIRKLAEGSEMYSPGLTQLHRELGHQVLSKFKVLYKNKYLILSKVQKLYEEYCDWLGDPESCEKALNWRQKWQQLLIDHSSSGPSVDVVEKSWPSGVQTSIGRFLYEIIMRDIKIDANIMKTGGSKSEQVVPAFYSIFRMQGTHMKEEIKPHPALVKLFQAACRDELTFDATLVPMVSPPVPWASIRTGGFLLSPAEIIRLPYQAHQQKVRLKQCDQEELYPALDSLNQLSSTPWRINTRVLDCVIEVFNNKGNDDLGVPPPPSECPAPPHIDPSMTRQEKYKAHKQRMAVKRKKAEMYSLWCDALYRFSLANHFRNDIFWFPHNMDFRGRVYPCPPHLNHLGADVARSILMFAKGLPLGPKGLDWLKLHCINLTGQKKRDSVQGRLAYANEILDKIMDSADHPLTGSRWWTLSDEPWQTLACCIEITNAVRSKNHEKYVCHVPIHQDGSCNGLQHYAALGRDDAGARSVNLAPSKVPQDVYSTVCALVEKSRVRDAANGIKIAQTLGGFIKRKVIKQTVMTTVYGVTRYGARLQIAKQLKDIPEFPKEHIWAASLYLVGRTFDSLQEMFTSTKEIQDWFTECAQLISQVCGRNVEWVTPLGLPVVQPYFRSPKRATDVLDPLKSKQEHHVFDMFERPNVMKQKNAFPPNYIHSLDSSHMMLTSLNCERSGITFVSVHDCFWTHPCSVEIMNKICREQFVALHSEPILENLSSFLVDKYSYDEKELSRDGSSVDNARCRLNSLLKQVPRKGTFDISEVLDSIYFFS